MKNKIFLILIIFIICLSGCNLSIRNQTKKDKDGFPIGTSNKENSDVLQVKVIIEKVNIRQKAKVNSNKVGIVKKGTILDVIKYETDNKYVWFKIKTGNHLEGYIASEKESPYVEINQEIDYLPPEITVKEEKISVNNRTELENTINGNVAYKDNIDQNPKLTYDIDYKKKFAKFQYIVEVMVTDSSNNSSSEEFKVEITGEKQMDDGVWLTYQDLINKQEQAKSLCYKYGLEPFNNGLRGCYNGTIMIESSPYIVLSAERCFYNTNMEPADCTDSNGNTVSHDLMSSYFKSIENQWSDKVKSYYADVKNATGYELSELTW